MTRSRKSAPAALATLEERLADWVAGIPADFRPPAEGTPRARILDAAARQFSVDGFSQSTTRAIAEAAGVNQAMIHYYFQSKTRLYERVLAGMIVDLLTHVAESLAPGKASPVDVLVGFPERIVALFAPDPVRTNIFRREIGNGGPHLRAVVDQLGGAGPRGFREIMLEYIGTARKSGAIAGDPATLMVFLLVHAYGAILIEPMLQHIFASVDSTRGLEQLVKSQRSLVRRALTQPTKEEPSP
jgi:AcrR family transcriptional regulator